MKTMTLTGRCRDLVCFSSPLAAMVILCTIATGCGSSDSEILVQPQVSQDGTRYYDIGEIVNNTDIHPRPPALMALTTSGTQVSGTVMSDSLGGYGVISGAVDEAARKMNLVMTFDSGPVMQCTVEMFPSGGWALDSCTITDGARVWTGWPQYLDPESHSAADYGVTDAGCAAIVIANNSPAFAIRSVRLRGTADHFDREYDGIAKGGNMVYTVPAGAYYVEVSYSEHSGNWTYANTLYDSVAAAAGTAVVFALEGGSYSDGIMYHAPDFEKK
ncbi:MAG: hypothetical protein WCL44_10030 [bacterium]